MRTTPARAAIVSGYFNPLHIGHLQMMEGASDLGDGYLVVIVNNDAQQEMKKGKVIFDEATRLRIVQALRVVDDAFIAVDDDGSVTASLRKVREAYPSTDLVFCNGGDRRDPDAMPTSESAVCAELGIEMAFGVGGEDKADSSSRVLEALGHGPDAD
ncbi:MAG: adenylyltransferase/cytidyltransferase family protein [Intrasporangiaceae bacterium]|nr:adenylyltransferase/cytidyltransferase family protein [Intrasporangiaceae bacterium]